MAKLDFPANPVLDQEYVFPPFTYKWDGEKWKTLGRGSSSIDVAVKEHNDSPNAHPALLKLDGSRVMTGPLATVGGNVDSFGDKDIIALEGKKYSFVTSPSDAHLCYNDYYDGEWKKYDDSQPSGHLVVNADGVRYYTTAAGVPGNPIANFDRYNIYHQGNKPTPAEIGVVGLSGINEAPTFGVNFTSTTTTWIAANFTHNTSDDHVVVGSLNDGATIGGHNNNFTGWTPLHINTYPRTTSNQEQAAVVMCNPHRQLVVQNDVGTPVALQYPVVIKGKYAANPNWWLSGSALRFMDGYDLMRSSTNNLRSNPDWAYINRFKHNVRITVNAPNKNIWSHVYTFTVGHFQSTNAASQSYIVPSQFDCHAGSGNQAQVHKQLVPSTENNGIPYFELHFPTGSDLPSDPSLFVQLEISSENVFE